MSLLSAIDRIENAKLEPFVAPVLSPRGRFFTVQNDIPYWLTFRDTPKGPGWYLLEPVSDTQVEVARVATVLEIDIYMNVLPSIPVWVVADPDDDFVVVTPYNTSDAAQRGWDGEPRMAYSLRPEFHGYPKPIQCWIAKIVGDQLVMSHPNMTIPWAINDLQLIWDTAKSDRPITRHGWGIVAGMIRHQIEEQRKSELPEDKILRGLAIAGVEVTNVSEGSYGRFQVTWILPETGEPVTQTFEPDGQVASAGICLSGRDRDYSSHSIVAIMQEGKKRGRF